MNEEIGRATVEIDIFEKISHEKLLRTEFEILKMKTITQKHESCTFMRQGWQPTQEVAAYLMISLISTFDRHGTLLTPENKY